MKTFLVCAMGEGDHYINSYVVAEVSKMGVNDITRMIRLISEHGVFIPWDGSTMRYVYQVVESERRKEAIDNDDMQILYKARVQKYNKECNGRI